jgi:hypothetical protein
MVAGHKSRCRLAALDTEHTELRTRAAVLEEQARAARADAERAEREREALHAQAAVRARGDAAAAQHGEAVRSFMASQEVGTARLSEAAAEWDALAAELALWLSEKGSRP